MVTPLFLKMRERDREEMIALRFLDMKKEKEKEGIGTKEG